MLGHVPAACGAYVLPRVGDHMLVIKRHWLQLIFQGSKTLEIRPTNLVPRWRFLACEGIVWGRALFGTGIRMCSDSQWRLCVDQHQVMDAVRMYGHHTFALPILQIEMMPPIPYARERGQLGTALFRAVCPTKQVVQHVDPIETDDAITRNDKGDSSTNTITRLVHQSVDPVGTDDEITRIDTDDRNTKTITRLVHQPVTPDHLLGPAPTHMQELGDTVSARDHPVEASVNADSLHHKTSRELLAAVETADRTAQDQTTLDIDAARETVSGHTFMPEGDHSARGTAYATLQDAAKTPATSVNAHATPGHRHTSEPDHELLPLSDFPDRGAMHGVVEDASLETLPSHMITPEVDLSARRTAYAAQEDATMTPATTIHAQISSSVWPSCEPEHGLLPLSDFSDGVAGHEVLVDASDTDAPGIIIELQQQSSGHALTDTHVLEPVMDEDAGEDTIQDVDDLERHCMSSKPSARAPGSKGHLLSDSMEIDPERIFQRDVQALLDAYAATVRVKTGHDERAKEDAQRHLRATIDNLPECAPELQSWTRAQALLQFRCGIGSVLFNQLHSAAALQCDANLRASCFYPMAVLLTAVGRERGLPPVLLVDAFFAIMSSIINKDVCLVNRMHESRSRYWTYGTANPGTGKSPALSLMTESLRRVLRKNSDSAAGFTKDDFHFLGPATSTAVMDKMMLTNGYVLLQSAEASSMLCTTYASSGKWDGSSCPDLPKHFLEAANGERVEWQTARSRKPTTKKDMSAQERTDSALAVNPEALQRQGGSLASGQTATDRTVFDRTNMGLIILGQAGFMGSFWAPSHAKFDVGLGVRFLFSFAPNQPLGNTDYEGFFKEVAGPIIENIFTDLLISVGPKTSFPQDTQESSTHYRLSTEQNLLFAEFDDILTEARSWFHENQQHLVQALMKCSYWRATVTLATELLHRAWQRTVLGRKHVTWQPTVSDASIWVASNFFTDRYMVGQSVLQTEILLFRKILSQDAEALLSDFHSDMALIARRVPYSSFTVSDVSQFTLRWTKVLHSASSGCHTQKIAVLARLLGLQEVELGQVRHTDNVDRAIFHRYRFDVLDDDRKALLRAWSVPIQMFGSKSGAFNAIVARRDHHEHPEASRLLQQMAGHQRFSKQLQIADVVALPFQQLTLVQALRLPLTLRDDQDRRSASVIEDRIRQTCFDMPVSLTRKTTIKASSTYIYVRCTCSDDCTWKLTASTHCDLNRKHFVRIDAVDGDHGTDDRDSNSQVHHYPLTNKQPESRQAHHPDVITIDASAAVKQESHDAASDRHWSTSTAVPAFLNHQTGGRDATLSVPMRAAAVKRTASHPDGNTFHSPLAVPPLPEPMILSVTAAAASGCVNPPITSAEASTLPSIERRPAASSVARGPATVQPAAPRPAVTLLSAPPAEVATTETYVPVRGLIPGSQTWSITDCTTSATSFFKLFEGTFSEEVYRSSKTRRSCKRYMWGPYQSRSTIRGTHPCACAPGCTIVWKTASPDVAGQQWTMTAVGQHIPGIGMAAQTTASAVSIVAQISLPSNPPTAAVPAPALRLGEPSLEPGPIEGSENWSISVPEQNRQTFFDLFSAVWGTVACKGAKPRRRFTLYRTRGASMIRGYHACLCSSQCQASWSTNSPKTAGAAWILRRSGNHEAGLDSVQLWSALNVL